MGEGGRGVRANTGKPALTGASPLRFNLTHAGDRAALAVAWEREVGIDLEPIAPELDLPPFLAVACTPAETARIEALPPSERVAAFLTLWTIKEAYLKAIGAGLSREPRAIAIDLSPDGRAVVHDSRMESGSPRWSPRLLGAGTGWVAALAVDGAEPEISVFAWPPDAKNVLAS